MSLFRRREKPTPFAAPSDAASPFRAPPVPTSPTVPLGTFAFVVDDVFSITGRGTVVLGHVTSGEVKVGDFVRFEDGAHAITSCVQAIEQFRKKTTVARLGDEAALLLAGVGRDQVRKGTFITGA